MTRLFVAVWPPPEVRAVLAALDRPAIPGVRWSAPEQWMVKVRPLGHVGDWVVPALIDVLEAELDGARQSSASLARPRAGSAGSGCTD
jgi:2'-5' RNA ligase